MAVSGSSMMQLCQLRQLRNVQINWREMDKHAFMDSAVVQLGENCFKLEVRCSTMYIVCVLQL